MEVWSQQNRLLYQDNFVAAGITSEVIFPLKYGYITWYKYVIEC